MTVWSRVGPNLALAGVLAGVSAGGGAFAQPATPANPPAMQQSPPPRSQELADRMRTVPPDQPDFGQAAGTLGADPETSEQAAPPQGLLVGFRPGSAKLTPSTTRKLDAFGHDLPQTSLAGLHLQITGFGDGTPSREANRDLAKRRANAVTAYLEQGFGVSASQIDITVQSGTPAKTQMLGRQVRVFVLSR